MGAISVFLALAIDFYLVSTAFSVNEDIAGSYTPGIYTAVEDGFEGPVEVTVEIGDQGGIKDLTIVGANETPDVGGAAIPFWKISQRILVTSVMSQLAFISQYKGMFELP